MTDPIDRLRSRNPMPDGDAPSGSLALADRIMHGSAKPVRASGWLVATSFATAVVAVGAVWLLWLGNGDDAGPIATDTTVQTSTTFDLQTTTTTTAVTDGTSGTTLPAIDASAERQLVALRSMREIIDEVVAVNADWEARQATFEETMAGFTGSYADAEAIAIDGDAAAYATRLADGIDSVIVGLSSPDDGTLRRDAVAALVTLRTEIVALAEGLGGDITDPNADVVAIAYFYMDPVGEAYPDMATLVPIQRHLVGTSGDPLTDALAALVDGVSAEESQSIPRISTALPAGASIGSINLGPALSIDLTGTTTEQVTREALAQIVLTAQQFGPRFVAVTVDGIPVVEDTMNTAAFEDLLPSIMIERPALDELVGNPLRVTGTANVFEASFSYALTNWDGLIIAEGFTTATCGTGCRGNFTFEIDYEVDTVQPGSLIVWEYSARDGSQVNIREHRVTLTPSATVPTPQAGLTIGSDSFGVDDGTFMIDFRWPRLI